MEILTFATAHEWESWLAEHSATASDAWLRIAKKNSRLPGLSITDALDAALCFGWIDSHRRGGDADSYLQRYSPRQARSPWSKINVDKVDALITAGRMREQGMAVVRAAQEDGRWAAAYPAQSESTTPPDLEQELTATPAARAFFDSLGRTAQYAVVLHILKAPNPRSRAERVGAAVTALADGRRP